MCSSHTFVHVGSTRLMGTYCAIITLLSIPWPTGGMYEFRNICVYQGMGNHTSPRPGTQVSA